jgi:hypothetical protein
MSMAAHDRTLRSRLYPWQGLSPAVNQLPQAGKCRGAFGPMTGPATT